MTSSPQFFLDWSYFLFPLCFIKIKELLRWNTRMGGRNVGGSQPFLIWKIQRWRQRRMARHRQQVLIRLDHNWKFPLGSKGYKNFAFKDRHGFKFWCCHLPSLKSWVIYPLLVSVSQSADGDSNRIYLPGLLWGLNKLTHRKCSTQCLVQKSKQHILNIISVSDTSTVNTKTVPSK